MGLFVPELRALSQYDGASRTSWRAWNVRRGFPKPGVGVGDGACLRLRLEGLEDHYPSQLSGGQQQRAALARMLASRPALILLDEPFSALDATLRWEMEQVVRQTINGFDGTALLVTHNRDEVYRLSDKVAVYLDGKINRFGEKWEIFAAPSLRRPPGSAGARTCPRPIGRGIGSWRMTGAFPSRHRETTPASGWASAPIGLN